MSYDRQRAADFALALMYLTLHDGVRAWKGISWDVLDDLFESGLISDPKRKAKSVVLTDEGLARSRALFEQLLASNETESSLHNTRRRKASEPESGPIHSPTISAIELARAEELLAPLCRPHPDPKVSAVLQIGHRVEGSAVVLFESRPRFQKRDEWGEHPVAKFRYVKSRSQWQLYCMMHDLKWHRYEPLPDSPDVATLIEEVRRDPTGIFWG
jgi:hypothetical protein